ncbi:MULTISPECIES: carboxymuconolactone decarboxylase family protein [unclassified Mycolicibacterium]|uniref:carboxymuconolactone decarboxylase family protein n=1 Tax=unclassified Mycolicibacterium TaxID=2636767 RepID=UPI0012DF9BBF|nr:MULTISPECIES: carboxymuconolactone decarboxylase family protein [unclassified Mycolicibacterium]MUL83120.1 carboxymuconolactone decarboxylase family protein [Mycolicibacterium sp. CBMA 329]MUL89455.1 carboxymuconolactone decarboxylase family protein [Mycolicibacterium sp. CBMA 331]MUL99144.1 carboxymuconolactone decarboxylase family protein [Mycolicibacterium sp. CBMA 334]MUM25705.1 carboxymuconolactone decarboxylase family protein [Mycolicibacterium sp. CBMA 295]MUM38971.1 carboxymuconolac
MLTPLPAEDWDDQAREALASTVPPERRHPDAAGNALSTLVRHPVLAGAFLPFNTYLQLSSTLPERIRELVILRTAFHHGCVYEWGHHSAMARRLGLTEADVDSARTGSAADEFDQAVLDAVDDLHAGSRISAEVWERLGQRLDDRQRMDLMFTFGGYSTLAFALNTFDVQLEDGAGTDEFYASLAN